MPPTRTTWSISSRRRVGHRLLDGRDDALEQIGRELGELRSRQAHLEVAGLVVDRRDERDRDLRLLRRGELDLRLLGLLVEALEGVLVLREVDSLVLLELGDHPLDDRLVPVVAAEVVVAGGREHLEDAVADLEDRDVEGAASEVEDEDVLVLGRLVDAVGERRGGRLVDDALDVEAGDLAGVLGCLALVVVEVGGDGDDRRVDGLAQLGLGVRLQLLEDHRGDLGRRVLLAAHVHAHVAAGAGFDLVRDDRLLFLDLGLLAAHEALDREDGVLGVHDGLALGDGADEAVAAVSERDDGRGGAPAFRVLEHGRLAAFEDGYARVGGSEVDSDGLTHVYSPGSVQFGFERNLSESLADLGVSNRSPEGLRYARNCSKKSYSAGAVAGFWCWPPWGLFLVVRVDEGS